VHELSITQSVVDLVAERAAGRTVVAVNLRVGRLSGVVPDAMQFCFEIASAGTPVEGAGLEIEEIDGQISCRSCGLESPVDDLVLLCSCGSADVEVVAGQELTVVSVELEKEATCA
jgi:hydrogenase nickel incorporation protein HypA/HybF